jgi:MoxR-like ATPase
MVNAALLLRRPLLVTGMPGTGKSTLAEAVAHELNLGEILVWPVTTKTTYQSGLYQYDAIGRLNAAAIRRERLELRRLLGLDPARPAGDQGRSKVRGSGALGFGQYLRLGPLGTALLPFEAHVRPDQRQQPCLGGPSMPCLPRVLLIDEIDKGDIDLPNDLLHVFERGWYEIPELSRLPNRERYRYARIRTHDEGERYAWIERGRVQCDVFPLVIMTSNGEREFPPAFVRRCLRLEMQQPTREQLSDIVRARLNDDAADREDIKTLIKDYWDLREGQGANSFKRELAVDQLLNAVYLVVEGVNIEPIREALFKSLTETF